MKKKYKGLDFTDGKTHKMGLIREPKNVDFTVESKPWTEQELADFRKLMKSERAKKRPAVRIRKKVAGKSKALKLAQE